MPLSAPHLPPNSDRAVLVPTLKDKLKLASVVKLKQRTLVTLESSLWEPVGLGRGGGRGGVCPWLVRAGAFSAQRTGMTLRPC